MQFARRCNTRHMIESGRARHALLDSSMKLYQQLVENQLIDCEWEKRGLLLVFLDESEFDEYTKTVGLVQEHFGIAATGYGPNEVVRLEPTLKSGLAGGWHYACDTHLRPDKLMTSWRSTLQASGVAIEENCEAKSLVCEGRRVRAVRTSRGEIPADSVVVATGACASWLGTQLGGKIPIQPGKGYSMTMPPAADGPRIPMIFHQHGVAVTPMQSGFRLGSTMEFSGYDTSINRLRLSLLKEGAGHYLQRPICDPVEEAWYGWRPMTYDGMPLIGPSPAIENVYVAAGHNMVGVSMAPATGKLIAELINGSTPHIDPAPYGLERLRSMR
jgi:D-amino-acid dehydrogenase